MVDINWQILLVQSGTFLLAVFVLWKFAWGPLTKMMQDRAQQIKNTIEQEKKKLDEASAVKAVYAQKLEELEKQATEILRQSAKDGKKTTEEIIRQAHIEAKKILENASRQIKDEQEAAMVQIKRDTVEISFQIAEKVLKEKIDTAMRQKFEAEFIGKLEGHS
ncbi:MAG: F0F1 ATP synthase subunit B [Endomicrobiales bacterium]|nr:F0F1 ATP synthase subunit B [Endomicrobiales bacterium]